MQIELKPLNEQVVVIVGASSGIGLATARMAAGRGATLVLAARNARELERVAEELRARGTRVSVVVADVADPVQVDHIARRAIDEYGGFDSWINVAGLGIYGELDVIPLEDMRRLFDVNFWGTVHGCRAAVAWLREHGGAVVNLGSVLSDIPAPLLGIYAASKHAVQGYADALRLELEAAHAPVSVSLVKPASIDTPFFQKARSYMGYEPRPLPPVYAPHVAAEAILHCTEHPTRDLFVGGAGKSFSVLGALAPRAVDAYLERMGFEQQRYDVPITADRPDNLYEPPVGDGGEGGYFDGHVMQSSAYNRAAAKPGLLLAAVGAGLALFAGARLLRGRAGRRGAEREVPLAPSDDGDGLGTRLAVLDGAFTGEPEAQVVERR